MHRLFRFLLLTTIPLSGIFSPTIASAAESSSHYVFTNDDSISEGNSATFYTVGNAGALTRKKVVVTQQNGIGGGFFGMKRLVALQSKDLNCVYISDAQGGVISSIAVSSLKVAGNAAGSKSDNGATNGIGLAVSSSILYASFADSNTIGTFRLEANCKLEFIGDTVVGGLAGGAIDGMALRGDIMVVTYVDGSIESFNISGGQPVSNGDEQYSTGSKTGNSYPSGVDITSDGHFAILGDISPSTTIEVSDISAGHLSKTIVYRLGKAISSGNVLLSPNESLLYISNTQGGTVTAAYFDRATGKLTSGCTSKSLKGYGNWTYLGGLTQQTTTGTGGALYAAEYGNPASFIAVINVQSSGGHCTLREPENSPIRDRASTGLLSIGSYPPRGF